MARERNMPELKRKGNWKNAPDDTPKKKATKATPTGAGAKPKPKPAKAKIGEGAKPKAKPAKATPSKASKTSPEPSKNAKARVARYKDKPVPKKTGSIYHNPKGAKRSPEAKAAKARSGTSDAAGTTRQNMKAKKAETKKTNASKSPSNRKPQKTGARSQNTSGTGYKEGSLMDRITRARRGTLKKKKKAPVPASRRKWGDQSA